MKVIPHFTPNLRVSPAHLLRLLRGAYGALFLFSGIIKLSDTAAFSAALDGFMIVPNGMPQVILFPIDLIHDGLWMEAL